MMLMREEKQIERAGAEGNRGIRKERCRKDSVMVMRDGARKERDRKEIVMVINREREKDKIKE